MQTRDDNTSLLSPLLSDGQPLLTLGALGLLLAGSFAIFLAAAGQFLPHDIQFLGMTAKDLCAKNACRIVHFMYHDRVSFGGTLIALSILCLWLIHFPLRAREPWAWWTLLISNIAGFASFLTYLGFGYFDTWHALATLVLLPCFAIGLTLAYRSLDHDLSQDPTTPKHAGAERRERQRPSAAPDSSLLESAHPIPKGIRAFLHPAILPSLRSRNGLGHYLLLATAATMIVAGLTISLVGMTTVFVPQDLQYMDTSIPQLNTLNPCLIPLIAHDRAGFGAGVLNVGFLILATAWCARPARHRWQALALAGLIGFTTAIGVHPLVGYNNPVHLAPACLGAVAYFTAMILTRTITPRNSTTR